ncbi:N-acetyltransferase [Desulfospira joergensenii]|uniref:N-acetyltransferase n=1 Tax=Desulfospira joergensenii TaxID=53329 RepID=UPI0003B53A06|nr:N-acetyltransferase [Desulfospira joergensenii]
MGKNALKPPFRIEVYNRPGRHLSDREFKSLVQNLQKIACSCFNELPDYQAMKGTREALSDKLISLAWDKDNQPAGFCSMVFLPVKGLGKVLHLGLTCVDPMARGNRLTHALVKKALTGYLLKQNPFGRIWVSNCAAVLSSLGNVAMHFENVYPSPFTPGSPGRTHIKIARAINEHFRDKMYVLPEAVLDENSFIFKGSVKDTVFHKNEGDFKYFHRKKYLNQYYAGMMDFSQGDEVLQIGYFRLASILKYYLRQHKIKKLTPVERPAVGIY